MPAVSVVMPVYNAEPYLNSSIISILKQSYRDFEFIIVNDGSQDKSTEIIRKFCNRDRRIKFLDYKSNEGSYVRLNYGIKSASSPIIVRQDADDISHPDRIKKLLHCMKINKDIACLGSIIKCISDNPADYTNGKVQGMEEWHNKYITPEQLYNTRFLRCPMLHGTAMFTLDSYKKVGGYDEQYFTGADYDFLMKLLSLGKMSKLNEKLYTYRIADKSLYHMNKQINLINSMKIRLKWLQKDFSLKGKHLESVFIICEAKDFDVMYDAAFQMDIGIAGFAAVDKVEEREYKGIKLICIEDISRNLVKDNLILLKTFRKQNIIKVLTSLGLKEIHDYIDVTG